MKLLNPMRVSIIPNIFLVNRTRKYLHILKECIPIRHLADYTNLIDYSSEIKTKIYLRSSKCFKGSYILPRVEFVKCK